MSYAPDKPRKHIPATIIRAPKDKENPYKAVRRATFEDKRLSWEARGILAYLLVKPDTWEISIADLWQAGDAGRDKIYRILAQLEKYGYLERAEVRERGKFMSVRYLLHEEPLPEIQDTVEFAPLPENQDTVDAVPHPENQEMATRVEPFPEKPYTAFQEHSNKEQSNKEESLEKEEMNERMKIYSFVHSSPTDAQMEIDDSFDLLTHNEVGIDAQKALELAQQYRFEELLRHVFAWKDKREKSRTFGGTGALLHRIQRGFSTPPLTDDQRKSDLFQHFHEFDWRDGWIRRHRDYAELEAQV